MCKLQVHVYRKLQFESSLHKHKVLRPSCLAPSTCTSLILIPNPKFQHGMKNMKQQGIVHAVYVYIQNRQTVLLAR